MNNNDNDNKTNSENDKNNNNNDDDNENETNRRNDKNNNKNHNQTNGNSNSNNNSKRRARANDQENKLPLYLPRDGQSLTSLFFDSDCKTSKSKRKQPCTESSSSSDEWVVHAGKHQNHRRHLLGKVEIVQRNMRRILRDPPIFQFTEGRTVYAPVRRMHDQDSVVKVYADGVKEPERMSTWNNEMKKSQTLEPAINARHVVFVPEKDMGNFSFTQGTSGNAAVAMTTRVNAWSSTAAEDDFEYPLYGDSDSDDYLDDPRLLKEIEDEEKESLKKVARATNYLKVVAKDVVTVEILLYVQQFKESWVVTKEVSSRLTAEANIDDMKMELQDITNRRLKDIISAMEGISYTSLKKLKVACKGLDETLAWACFLEWNIKLLDGQEDNGLNANGNND